MSTQQVTGSFVEQICQADPKFRETHKGFKIIDIRTAAEQYYLSTAGSDDGSRIFSIVASLDRVMPPFPGCIFEFQAGEREFIVTGEEEREDVFEYKDAAVVLETVQVDVETKIWLDKAYPGNNVAWSVTVDWFLSDYMHRDEIGHSSAHPYFFINRDGSLLNIDGRLVAFCSSLSFQGLAEMIAISVLPVLFAINLMHCKNVTLDSVTTPLPLSMKKSKRRKQIEERKKHPAFERHVVVIRDRKGRTVQSGLREEGLQRRLHIVRGHFRTYSQAAPLFGRIAGRFWIPAHLAGFASEGVIDSDYRLEVA